MMRASLAKSAVVLAAMLGLAACGSDSDDLDQYINEIKARPGGRIEPLPEITPYEVFTYQADVQGFRSPFMPDIPAVASAAGGGVRPEADRPRHYLESYPLDSLGMVGTLNIGGTDFGLIQDPQSLIHRVTPGDYMGQNDGRITEITDSEIKLVEIISDGIGGYIERDAAIGISD